MTATTIPKIKLYDNSTQTFKNVDRTVIAEAKFEDNGESALNKLSVDFTNDVKSGTANPFFNRQIKFTFDSTDVFGGRVEKRISETPLIRTVSWSYAAEFMDRYVNEVYENTTPEAIVADVINKYTNLTYASSNVTGLTITRIAFGDKTVAEVIELLARNIDYYFYADPDLNAYFEPLGAQSTGEVITIESDALMPPTWDYVSNDVITKVIVEGERQNIDTSETFVATASQTDFTLEYAPVGKVKVTDNGTEQDPIVDGSTTGDYTIDTENKKIVFDTGRTSGHSIVVEYSYSVPIKVTQTKELLDDDGNAILRERKIVNKSIKTYQEARKLGKSFLESYGRTAESAEVPLKEFNPNLEAGKTVRVIDAREGIDNIFLVRSVEYLYSQNRTVVQVGARLDYLEDWMKDAQNRLRQLEQENTSSDLLQDYVNVNHKLRVGLTHNGNIRLSSPGNSFILGHHTLGRLRTSGSFEPDCSAGTNHGQYYGSGTYYESPDYTGITTFSNITNAYPVQRLSCGLFNGTDQYLQATAAVTELDNTQDFSVFVATNLDTGENDNVLFHNVTGGIRTVISYESGEIRAGIRNAGGWFDKRSISASTNTLLQIEVTYDQSLSNMTLKVNGSSSTGTSAPRSTTTAGLTVGRRGNSTYYWKGKADELMVFDSIMADAVFTTIKNNTFDSTTTEYSNLLLYWSFDNPLLGARRSSQYTHEEL